MSGKGNNNQTGRRTPLSLSGSVTKAGQNQNTRSSTSLNSSNGHTNNLKMDNKNKTEAAELKESKTKLQKPTADTDDVKIQKQLNSDQTKPKPPTSQNVKKQLPSEKQEQQQQQNEKQQQQQNEKQQQQQNVKQQQQQNEKQQQQQNVKQQQHQNEQQQEQQNGVSSNNHKTAENNQQQKNKGKKNSADAEAKPIEKHNKKNENNQDSNKNVEKGKNKIDDEKKTAEEKFDNGEKKEISEKPADVNKLDNKDIETKDGEVSAFDKDAVKNAGTEHILKDNEINKTDGGGTEAIDLVEESIVKQQNSPKSVPGSPHSVKGSKPSTPNRPTPTKNARTPQKNTPKKREVTTCVDDYDVESFNYEGSPSKSEGTEANAATSAPCATSTPGKIVLQKPSAKASEQQASHAPLSSEYPRTFSQISGRRAIRPVGDYTPSKFQSNLQFRESYRRINTELDVTNTSLNVTVGSEIPDNASFSFFGRGRKRDRTPPKHSQSAVGELQHTTALLSPPKKARMDFFSVVSTPITMLRNRFSRATIQSSTPVKLQQKIEETEEDEVHNVSGNSVHEVIEQSDAERSSVGGEDKSKVNSPDNTPDEENLDAVDDDDDKEMPKLEDVDMYNYEDIKITETPLSVASENSNAKNNKCVVM